MAIDTKDAKLNQEQGEDQTDSLAFALWKSWPYGGTYSYQSAISGEHPEIKTLCSRRCINNDL